MKNLLKFRESIHLNRLALAMRTGMSREMVSAYERDRSNSSISTRRKLCEEWDASVDYLLDRTSIPVSIERFLQKDLSEKEVKMPSVYRKLPVTKQKRTVDLLIGMLYQD